ncbi:MAG: hypothetical protein RLZZ148_1460 [Cyanobacteriota bacterium]|jgi:hypothetical protein
MASINISDLHPAGFDLLSDSESYLHELKDTELSATRGGITPLIVGTIIVVLLLRGDTKKSNN